MQACASQLIALSSILLRRCAISWYPLILQIAPPRIPMQHSSNRSKQIRTAHDATSCQTRLLLTLRKISLTMVTVNVILAKPVNQGRHRLVTLYVCLSEASDPPMPGPLENHFLRCHASARLVALHDHLKPPTMCGAVVVVLVGKVRAV